ncbi:hypothetical protein THASP1DRAFT_26670 [Thamnocephalis sphaerospora]|uniref:SAP domain-containing protein n=1 Tax=Thamnocephalis sphaerospora TaxID=78915 RepID=A0A4V1IVP1_9FUNG|nr:hypothetical protein THASP1DRAFT_26670 [Thamnocephalis sphaerospora]|eukprot:RKP04739.1 hypothetical protein THASP1DRAFT_26670 [Thamnocephalis sphaerospora]
MIEEARINHHLDRCLDGNMASHASTLATGDRSSTSRSTSPVRTAPGSPFVVTPHGSPRPTAGLGLGSSARLLFPARETGARYEPPKMKKLKLGIPTQGSRQVLIKRHQEFLKLYSANADAPRPKSHTAVVRDLMEAERHLSAAAQNSHSRSSSANDGPQSSRNGASSSVPKMDHAAMAAHAEQYADEFRRLVAEARASAARMKEEEQQNASSATTTGTLAAPLDVPSDTLIVTASADTGKRKATAVHVDDASSPSHSPAGSAKRPRTKTPPPSSLAEMAARELGDAHLYLDVIEDFDDDDEIFSFQPP